MLDAQHPESTGYKLSEDEVIAEMILFLMAGYDTSSNVLTLSCYHLAIYPEIQEKVVEEIQRVCQSPDGVTYDEIKDMTYLEAVICETLRLFPPGMLIKIVKSLNPCWNSFKVLSCVVVSKMHLGGQKALRRVMPLLFHLRR